MASASYQRQRRGARVGARRRWSGPSQEAPGNADCWALLSIHVRGGVRARIQSAARSARPRARRGAARRRAAPSNHLAHHALAPVLFFRREFSAFRSAAERAIALNPMDGCTMAYLGSLIAYSGDWEHGCALGEAGAVQLNPNHPGWYWFADCFNAYRQGDYRGALDIASKDPYAGILAREPGARRGLRPARRARIGRLEPCASCSRCRPAYARSARGASEVVGTPSSSNT